MSILIRGMEMPKENEVICIFPNGIVQKRVIKWSSLYEVLERSNAVPVPPHGRLIDADALKVEFPEPSEANGGWRNPNEAIVHKTGIWACIDCAPTIIPAEEGE